MEGLLLHNERAWLHYELSWLPLPSQAQYARKQARAQRSQEPVSTGHLGAGMKQMNVEKNMAT